MTEKEKQKLVDHFTKWDSVLKGRNYDKEEELAEYFAGLDPDAEKYWEFRSYAAGYLKAKSEVRYITEEDYAEYMRLKADEQAYLDFRAKNM